MSFVPAPGLPGIHYLQGQHDADWLARSYFVRRARGNILVSPFLYQERLGDWIESHGGLALVFVTHRDEVDPTVLSRVGRSSPGPLPERIPACQFKARFECQLAVHEADAGELTECGVDLLWTEDFRPASDLRFVHTPGHTAGSASLLLRHRGRRLLFCGDNLVLGSTGEVLDEGSSWQREAWSKLLRLGFDVLLPLHTRRESPVPFLLSDAQTSLRKALDAQIASR